MAAIDHARLLEGIVYPTIFEIPHKCLIKSFENCKLCIELLKHCSLPSFCLVAIGQNHKVNPRSQGKFKRRLRRIILTSHISLKNFTMQKYVIYLVNLPYLLTLCLGREF